MSTMWERGGAGVAWRPRDMQTENDEAQGVEGDVDGAEDVRRMRPLAPGRRIDARVRIPGSKSLTNRALVLAAMAKGRSRLVGALRSDDTVACTQGLRDLGIAVRVESDGEVLVVEGSGGGPTAAEACVDARLSGTTARFLAPYLALGRGRYRLDAAARMRERPMGALWQALRDQGVRIDGGPALPWTVYGAGGLAGGALRIGGDDTTQPASGLLMAGPFARRDLELTVDSRRAALPHVAMTAGLMARFGVACESPGEGRFRVPAGAVYRPGTYEIEPDASAAAYFWALAALSGGRVHTPGIGRSRLQGDAAFLEVLEEMGCRVEAASDGGAVVQGPDGGRLRAVRRDMSAMGDQVLTLGVLGLFADGPCEVHNVSHIRLQESDRVAAAVTELRRLGACCEERPDGFAVWPLSPEAVAPVRVRTYGDHRLAMSFALAGLRRPGVVIADPGCVSKTFPSFFQVLDGAVG